jgi:2',3'-cyclic-nucleotide 2'-phosphodiesterase (5'-nucleotidase family)
MNRESKMFSRILGSTAILAGLSMAAPVAADTTLHILHINDLHSRIAADQPFQFDLRRRR